MKIKVNMLGLLAVFLLAIFGCNSKPTNSGSLGAAAPLSIKVVGNKLVDGSGNVVVLHGVNRSGSEFECAQSGTATSRGWGIMDGPTDLASVQNIANWNANVVRIPLNEDCWLGINGENPVYSGTSYQTVIKNYVNVIHQAGLYVILDLHWNAPADVSALAQQPMPDADHAIAFWTSVATLFKDDPAVLFDLYNEPFLYGNYLQTSGGDVWACWLNGCGLNQYLTGGSPYTSPLNWNAVGMQTLINTVRATGATQPVMVAGLDWASDMSGWLSHRPTDSLNQVVAAWHSYPGQPSANTTYYANTIGPIIAQVPMVIGETGDSTVSATTYVQTLLPWADSKGVSYLAWTWNTWADGANILIKDYNGTPTAFYGQYFKDHLLSLKVNPVDAGVVDASVPVDASVKDASVADTSVGVDASPIVDASPPKDASVADTSVPPVDASVPVDASLNLSCSCSCVSK